jgi:catechol 2,3-dioxygenase-like lactoylglutathione lyase family enzyme
LPSRRSLEETVIDAVAFVSISVADQDRAKKFYTDQLGFELVLDFRDEGDEFGLSQKHGAQ